MLRNPPSSKSHTLTPRHSWVSKIGHAYTHLSEQAYTVTPWFPLPIPSCANVCECSETSNLKITKDPDLTTELFREQKNSTLKLYKIQWINQARLQTFFSIEQKSLQNVVLCEKHGSALKNSLLLVNAAYTPNWIF